MIEPAAAPTEVDVVTQLGPPFIGLLLSTILFGITLLQALLYYTIYGKQDMLFHKLSLSCSRSIVVHIRHLSALSVLPLNSQIGAVCAFDALHTALISYAMYNYLIQNALNPSGWTTLSPAMKASIVVNLMLTLMVQTLYVIRLWIGINIFIAYRTCSLNSLQEWNLLEYQQGVYLALGSLLVTDTIIAASLCLELHTRKTGFIPTDTLLTRYMFYFLNAGAVISLTVIAEITVYTTMQGKGAWFALGLVLPKLYVNCYLAMLNGRPFMRRQGIVDTGHRPSHVSSLRFDPQRRSHGTPTLDIQRSGIRYDIELEGARASDSATESSARDSFRDRIEITIHEASYTSQ
ncbi:hypothetical protein FIBSPDRAFT_952486 [Athelia psychrophila]|uniref:DUF6534 domain-containing protein n=1 Tax=Athelia psychrophila TaxID=1759441 RepID=A0A166LG08_9AGAM|nr:hypothetical protein FIBSPDRAFT_952486 [Fibularhizoctonia sp. CBS 109695]